MQRDAVSPHCCCLAVHERSLERSMVAADNSSPCLRKTSLKHSSIACTASSRFGLGLLEGFMPFHALAIRVGSDSICGFCARFRRCFGAAAKNDRHDTTTEYPLLSLPPSIATCSCESFVLLDLGFYSWSYCAIWSYEPYNKNPSWANKAPYGPL